MSFWHSYVTEAPKRLPGRSLSRSIGPPTQCNSRLGGLRSRENTAYLLRSEGPTGPDCNDQHRRLRWPSET